MRMQPVENPGNIILKLIYRMVKFQFGKVLTPVKVIYARKPKFLSVLVVIDYLLNRNITISPSFKILFQAYVSMLNGCNFCQDIRHASAVEKSIGIEKFNALNDFHASPLFDDREKSALAFAEEFSRQKKISNETYSEMQKHFSETEIVELIWINASEHYFNSLLVPLDMKNDDLRLMAEMRIASKRK